MDNKRLLSMLLLFVLAGLAQADPPLVSTTLMVSGPPSLIYLTPTTFVTMCAYYNYTGSPPGPVPSPTITFYLDGTAYSPDSSSPYCHSWSHWDLLPNIAVGVHTWYVTASAAGFQPQTSSAYAFAVNAATSLTQVVYPSSPQYANTPIVFSAVYTDESPSTPVTVDGPEGTIHPNREPVTGAAVVFYIDGVQHSATSSLAAAMKTKSNGYFYIPNMSGVDSLKVELFYNDTGQSCSESCSPDGRFCGGGCIRYNIPMLEGDQAGGSFYAGVPWPDGKVDSADLALLSQCLGKNEGDVGWNYMCDITADRKVDSSDISLLLSSFGNATNSYSSDRRNISIQFNNIYGTVRPSANGFVSIPKGATSFTVYNDFPSEMGGTLPVPALVTFWRSYSYTTSGLSVGTHSWSFNASKDSYQPQTGPTLQYNVPTPTALTLTTLTQSVTPASGTEGASITPTFTCGYTASGASVTGATVNVTVVYNTINTYTAVYNPSSGDYRYSGVLHSGINSWYCSASKTGYQSQVNPSAYYNAKEFTTNLNQFASPTSPEPPDTSTTFFANYSNSTSSPVTGASVTLYIDNSPYPTSYANGLYYATITLSVGIHSWKFNASKTACQTQTGPTLQYRIIRPITPGGSPLIRKCMDPDGCNPLISPAEPQPKNEWMLLLMLITTSLGIVYFGVRSRLDSE